MILFAEILDFGFLSTTNNEKKKQIEEKTATDAIVMQES